MTTAKADQALQHLLQGFSPREGPSDIWTGTAVRVDPKELPVPGVLLFLLTRVMGMWNLGKEEKTAWHVPVDFRGHRVTIASQKFGLCLYVIPAEGSGEPAEAIAADVVRRLQKALDILERTVLRNRAKEQLRQGHLTIANQAGRQRAMYQHFRDAAAAAFVASQRRPAPSGSSGGMKAVVAAINERLHQSQVGAWEAMAAVNAYFSLLEHELVLISAFSDLELTGGAIEVLIGDRWGDKFRKLFDLSDSEAKRSYDHLHEIAETYRNPYSHGGFDKQGAALWFHLDGIGAVPAGLSDIRSSPHFELFPIQPQSFATICATIDDTDRWLRGGGYAAAFEWVDAGLNVAFDPPSRAKYRELAKDPERLRAEIERRTYLHDRAENMDW